MYQNIHIKRSREGNIVYLWDDTQGFRQFKFDSYCYVKDPNGEYTNIYGDKCSKIYKWAGIDENDLFENDVNLTTRVLVDTYPTDETPSTGHVILNFDIEVETDSGFPEPMKGQNTITSIAAHDSVTDTYTVFILDENHVVSDSENGNRIVKSYDNEHDLLYGFLTYWESVRPTIVTGWNCDDFDVPYLYNRMINILGVSTSNRLSPIGEITYSKFKRKYQIAGVSVLDYLQLYKNFTYTIEASYSLEAISMKELKRGKVKYEGSLDQLFRDDIDKFIEYNITDVELVVELDRKLQFIDLARGICHAGRVPYEEFTYSSKYLEGAILTFLKNKNMVACNKMKDAQKKMKELEDSGEKGFAGAFVKDPIAGKYNWIYDLDLTSLYPSIIMSLNISPETKIGLIGNWDVEKFVKGTQDEWYIGGKVWEDAKLRETLKEMNISVSSNGVMYRNDIRGCIPEILSIWFDQRLEYKNLMTEYGKAGDDEKYKFYKQRQLIQKVLLNSLYGVLGLPVFRFYDVDNALAVTATGQDVILNTAKMANLKYNQELNVNIEHVKYIDTDSIYVHAEPVLKHRFSDYNTWDDLKIASAVYDLADEMQSYLNVFYDKMAERLFNCHDHRFEIKKETVARRAIFVTKKRYAQWLIMDNGVPVDELNVKGLDMVRSSFPTAFRKLMGEVLTEILNDADRETITDMIVTFKKNIHSAPVVDVAKNTGLTKWSEWQPKADGHMFDFKKSCPAQYKAAIAYNQLLEHFKCSFKYEPIKHNHKIKWVYLKNNPYGLDALAFLDDSIPDEINNLLEQYADRGKMFSTELESKLQQFYDTLKWGTLISDKTTANKFFSFN